MSSLINFARYYTVRRWFLCFLGQKYRILDFGCGNGELVYYLRQKGQEAYGVDPEVKSVPFLFKSLADLEKTVHGSFKAIILNFSLEHCDDPISILKRLRDLLSSNGLIFIKVPNLANILKHRRLSSFQLKITSHRHHFSSQKIIELLNNSGFRALKIDTRFCTTAALTIPCSIFPRLDPMEWINEVRLWPKILKGSALGILSFLFYPYVFWESQIGRGFVLHAVAQKIK
ncbi:MAG: class I SAM-dependent methyltransferase [Candidatus Omnitrophica bacterium]|nr:class I SAM-dependent methyltransferase [Candidatus Omnitrophota bacterium]